MTKTEAVAAWRKAQAEHKALKLRQKADRKALNSKQSGELAASRGNSIKALRVAERLARAEMRADVEADAGGE